MRTVIVRFWGNADHPKELGRVEHDSSGPARLVGFPPELQAALERGLDDRRGSHPVRRTLADGDAFLDAVLWEFRGGYVRAEERTA